MFVCENSHWRNQSFLSSQLHSVLNVIYSLFLHCEFNFSCIDDFSNECFGCVFVIFQSEWPRLPLCVCCCAKNQPRMDWCFVWRFSLKFVQGMPKFFIFTENLSRFFSHGFLCFSFKAWAEDSFVAWNFLVLWICVIFRRSFWNPNFE